MTQPTALFLADILEDAGKPADIAEKCAAELRRLHAELERCKQVCAATSESWQTDAEKWGFQRDALLEALKSTHAMLQATLFIMQDPEARFIAKAQLDKNRSAIKAAEENT